MRVSRLHGIVMRNGIQHEIDCIATGPWSDGTKVWTECTKDKKLVKPHIKYRLVNVGHCFEFIQITGR